MYSKTLSSNWSHFNQIAVISTNWLTIHMNTCFHGFDVHGWVFKMGERRFFDHFQFWSNLTKIKQSVQRVFVLSGAFMISFQEIRSFKWQNMWQFVPYKTVLKDGSYLWLMSCWPLCMYSSWKWNCKTSLNSCHNISDTAWIKTSQSSNLNDNLSSHRKSIYFVRNNTIYFMGFITKHPSHCGDVLHTQAIDNLGIIHHHQ